MGGGGRAPRQRRPGRQRAAALALACKLCSHMLVSEHIFYSMLRIIGDELKQSADPAGRRRARPDSADWWRRRPRCGGLIRHVRFVHVISREDVARARELAADASDPSGRGV